MEKENIRIRKVTDPITHATKPHSNALNNRIWDENEIIYWKMDSEYEFIPKKKQENLTKLAFLESSLETPLVIRKRNRSSADAQLLINWLGAKDEPYFKGKFSTLAFAYGPARGLGGDVTMNADQPWWFGKLTMKQAYDMGMIQNYNRAYPDRPLKTFDPLHTMKHEGGGHSIGLDHITNQAYANTAIMYPYYNGLRKFGAADKTYLHELYGNANLLKKIKEILLNRVALFS